MGSETTDPENAQSSITVCFDEIKSPDSDSGEMENPVSDSDEIKNTASHAIKSEVNDSLPDLVDESEEEEYFINAVDNDQIHDWNMVLQTNDSQIEYKLDTGSQVNIITKRTFQNLDKKGKINCTNAKLTAYDGGNIEVIGKCILRVGKLNRKTYPVEFFIVDAHSPSIIGLKTCERLDLIKRVYLINDIDPNLLEEFADTFGDIGCLPGEYKIKIDPSVDPVIEPPRRIPFSLQKKMKIELDRMESLNVIEKVTHPTDWVSNIVVVEKSNGKLRLCLDPRNLNKAIKREHFQLPTVDDIMAKMPGAKIFSKLDASSGYWQIRVDDESADLLTFNTPFGRYRFNHLPFGVWSASEIFGKSIFENIIQGLEGVANIQDNIIVWGSTPAKHDERLQHVLEKCREANLKLNKEKCEFRLNELKFVGHIFSADGVQADPEKVEAISGMPSPRDKSDLRRFLGMINYLGKFMPNLSEKTALLRSLLEKDVLWSWSDKHEECFCMLKKLVTESPILKYYDPNKEMKLSVDASKYGLGAVLLQKYEEDWAPVAYGSRSLTRSEMNYAQIEKETLAILFGCNKFNQHLYGVKFTVESDHQPLESIFKRPISKAPPRIQRFLLRLQKYQFEVEFSPGKNLVVSDTLSRAPLEDSTSDDKGADAQIHMLFEGLPVSDKKLELLKKETENHQTP